MAVTGRAAEIPRRGIRHALVAVHLDLESVSANAIARSVADEATGDGARQVAIGLKELGPQNHAAPFPSAPVNKKGQVAWPS